MPVSLERRNARVVSAALGWPCPPGVALSVPEPDRSHLVCTTVTIVGFREAENVAFCVDDSRPTVHRHLRAAAERLFQRRTQHDALRTAGLYPYGRGDPMTRTTVYCDRCKHPVARGSQTELLVEGWNGPPQSRRESIDLCAPCSSALAAWLSVPALNHPPLRAARSAAVGA